MGMYLFLSVLVPIFLAGGLLVPGTRPLALWCAPWAALPAFAAALLLPIGAQFHPEWLFLGGAFVLDPTAKVFLAFSAGIWLAAGIYAKGYLEANHDSKRVPFFAFFLGTMGGNLALICAQDMVSYIAFFALMSFCAYGLIVHERSPGNLFAGRIYIAMTVVGEVAAFGGMVWAASLAGGQTSFAEAMAAIATRPERVAILSLLFIGFGIKLGVMPLHAWLPLAHPAAPTPASAVLSGVMIKTGLLLWLRLFPFNEVAVLDGGFLVAVGLVTAFAAALIGMTQTHPKALLAYSSVSQMGLAAVAVGVGLLLDAGHAVILGAVLLFAVHHAIAKSALFLGTGIAACEMRPTDRRVLNIGLAVSGAALAGIPFTSGMAAKAGIKAAAALTDSAWTPVLDWLLPLTGITTMLLIMRFLFIITPAPTEPHGRVNLHMMLPWTALTLAVPMTPVFILALGWAGPRDIGLYPQGLAAAFWPPLLGVIIGIVVWKSEPLRVRLAAVRIPPGDIVFPLSWAGQQVRGLLRVTVLRPAIGAQGTLDRLVSLIANYRNRLIQRAAKYETFALGMILMTAIALGMAFIL